MIRWVVGDLNRGIDCGCASVRRPYTGVTTGTVVCKAVVQRTVPVDSPLHGRVATHCPRGHPFARPSYNRRSQRPPHFANLHAKIPRQTSHRYACEPRSAVADACFDRCISLCSASLRVGRRRVRTPSPRRIVCRCARNMWCDLHIFPRILERYMFMLDCRTPIHVYARLSHNAILAAYTNHSFSIYVCDCSPIHLKRSRHRTSSTIEVIICRVS